MTNNDRTPAADVQPTPASARRGARPLLIGAGLLGGVLLIGGVGTGIALAATDEGAGSGLSLSAGTTGSASPAGSPTPADSPTPAGDSAPLAASDVDALIAAIDAAVAAAGGTGATSIEVERGGWDVDVLLADGTEVDVRVAADGTTAVRPDDDGDDDRSNDPVLDTAKLGDIAAAAIAAAGSGSISSIETDDDDVAYEVEIDLGNGRDADVELSASLAVVEVDTD